MDTCIINYVQFSVQDNPLEKEHLDAYMRKFSKFDVHVVAMLMPLVDPQEKTENPELAIFSIFALFLLRLRV